MKATFPQWCLVCARQAHDNSCGHFANAGRCPCHLHYRPPLMHRGAYMALCSCECDVPHEEGR